MKKAVIVVFVAALTMLSPALAGGNCGGLAEVVASLPYEDLSVAEEGDLLWMREEEKLARDVYLAMDDIWGMRIFSQISWSEQSHMDALYALVDKYGLVDSVGDNAPGVFTDPDLQLLFNDLLAQGSQSIVDALVVGATIEDLDIYDLEGALARADNLDLRTVYQNLQKGSRNHLRSFTGVLEANDVVYEPQFLSPADFEEIVNSSHEQGMLDADGEPMDCPGGNRGNGQYRMNRGDNGPGPGDRARQTYQRQHALEQR